jgi:hypothetical protein
MLSSIARTIMNILLTWLLVGSYLGNGNCSIAIVYLEIDIGAGINVVNVNGEHNIMISRKDRAAITNFKKAAS